MARYKPDHKAATRRKVVDAALDTFRKGGVESTSIAAVMQELGLTVGGFYRHFESKSTLLVEAVKQGIDQSIAFIRAVPVPADGKSWSEAVAERYLSSPHRENIAQGCALAALGPEIARADEDVRAACEAGLRRLQEAAREHLGATAPKELNRFWALIALNLGGLILSRMVADANTAEEILRTCRNGAKSLVKSSAK
jgi:TetR/AcrR family transcriptional regulator, transcriptional repressor for nem operon